MAAYIWYLTTISRDNSTDLTWDVTGASIPLDVWFGDTGPGSNLPADGQWDLIISNTDGDNLVDSPEFRAALQNYGISVPNSSSFFGIDQTTEPLTGLEATIGFTQSGSVASATSGYLISLQPITVSEITATYKPGVGNFPGFNPGSFYVPCFARGTLIQTPDGQRSVESLRVGDLVLTADHGAKPILWIGSKRVTATRLDREPELRPIRIRKGALGEGQPTRDLIVSPQHRILVRSRIAQKMFGTNEVLVAAKQLLQIEGIDIAEDLPEVEYFHFLFDQHEVVLSNGAETESLYVGPMALKGIGPAAREEIFKLFPELRDGTTEAPGARPLASGRMGRKLANRHIQHDRPLVETHRR